MLLGMGFATCLSPLCLTPVVSWWPASLFLGVWWGGGKAWCPGGGEPKNWMDMEKCFPGRKTTNTPAVPGYKLSSRRLYTGCGELC